MKGDVEEEAPRPRPLSGGIWTLFSWLRRTDRSSSSESITSVGSDRTAASFDFFAPIHYNHSDRDNVLPHSPITDTYRKRIQERNIRRQNDRDITLRRKYGLYSEELGYDAFSLPPARKLSKDSARQRRATSETIQRRAAYVPGKRRAPLPPTTVISTSLPRNYKRKRPAPKPPLNFILENKKNIVIKEDFQMSAQPVRDKLSYDTKSSLESKVEKAKKQDMGKDIKLRTEKSFLKQIFDNRKRNSAIDTSHVKLLPSISELDKEAAEIIQKNRSLRTTSAYCDNDSIMKLAEIASSTTGNWICTICLRKYNSTVIACVYCVTKDANRKSFVNNTHGVSSNVTSASSQTEQNVTNKNKKLDADEKKKLREMLKEMKDSLPKRPKHEKVNKPIILTETETPTLRIGSTMKDTNYNEILPNNIKPNKQHESDSLLTAHPSSSKQIVSDIILSNIKSGKKERHKIHSNNSKLPTSANSLKIFFLNDNKNMIEDNSKLSIQSDINNLEKGTFIDNHVNKIGGEVIANNGPVGVQNAGKNSKTLTQNDTSNMSINKPQESIKNQDGVSFEIPNTVNVRALTSTSTQNILKSEEKAEIKQEKLRGNLVLVPINEIEISNKPSHDFSNSKIDSIRIGDVISSDRVQNLETSKSSPSSVSSSTDLRTPLKISSLLNPLYLPKEIDSNVTVEITNKKKIDIGTSNLPLFEKPNINKPINVDSEKPSTSSGLLKQEPDNSFSKKCEETIPLQGSKQIFDIKQNIADHHARRRDLVNQLEQAIARGDEQIAAEAAAKLAKLKLSCSVLSFSSQIVGESVMSKKNDIVKDINLDKENRIQQTPEKSISYFNVKTEIKINVLPEVKPETSKEATVIENKCFDEKNKINIKAKNVNEPIPTTSKQVLQSKDQLIAIEVWVEDKEAARGPIQLRVPRKAMVGELKLEAEKALGIEIRLQRWIIGKALCSNDNTPLFTLAGPNLNAPFYLCLVESETNKDNSTEPVSTDKNSDKLGNFYTELMKLEQQALVLNIQEFECGVCIEQCAVGAGAVLRECIHTFCKECLRDVVRHCEEPVVTCPAIGCPGVLQEREIRALLAPKEYERWLARGLAAAESGTRNAFHCRTKDCTGWALCEPGVRRFPCPVCKHTNCLPCQAIHEGETCEKYQARLRDAVNAVEANESDEGTQALLKSLIDKGEALECPDCKAIITKKWGCDWIKCSACKTEICWVTKGRRWGPGGKGDTSGGCRCGVDGKRCHPSCGYCH